ncbi:MAG: AAA family ATPase [Lachnospiraceae bacterium]|nr:AAA family ATPase [Lachnospiraceae bacterium]
MGWRINKIIFENFKVFKNRYEIELEGKHFLLFGENGSGKSSIGWGLYTFLQSVLKMPDINEAQKYFNHTHEQHLRNKFSNDADHSGITIEFIDPTSLQRLTKEDSIQRVDTHIGGSLSIPYSLAASDFLNYRYLNSLFDFKNSETNDIFPIMLHEVFPIDSLQHAVIDINGVSKGRKIRDWWITLNDYLRQLPKENAPREKYTLQHGLQWDTFIAQLDTFNQDLTHYLSNIEIRANHLLLNTFKIKAEITLSYTNANWEVVYPNPSNGNIKLCKPKIHLNARFLHPGAVNQNIKHPRSFFNEASLSKMALALRLAITENRLMDAPDLCKILVIDDILISLDMANRLSVIDILLDYSSSFQMIILTHDRSFFNIVRNKIEDRKQKGNWKCSQIYIKPDLTRNQVPEVVISNIKDGLDQAKDYYLSAEFEAAVVCLRKECEACLKKIVPLIRIIDRRQIDKGEIVYQDLKSMIKQFYIYLDEHFTLDLAATMPNPSPNLHTFRQLLLNKAAHNDYGSPRFNSEILQAFTEITELCAIKKTVLVHSSKIGTDTYKFSITDNAGIPKSFSFTFGDVFSVLSANGIDYVINAHIIVSSNIRLLKSEIRQFCNLHRVSVPTNILQNITNTATGTTLDTTLSHLRQ